MRLAGDVLILRDLMSHIRLTVLQDQFKQGNKITPLELFLSKYITSSEICNLLEIPRATIVFAVW